MAKFLVERDCWHNGNRWRAGEVVEIDGNPKSLPRHLTPLTKIEALEKVAAKAAQTAVKATLLKDVKMPV